MIITTPISQAKKTRDIAVTYRAGPANHLGTCPPSCPLMPAQGVGSPSVDHAYLRALLSAVPPAGRSFAYTHYHPRHWASQWEHRQSSGLPCTVVNFSCDSPAQANVLARFYPVPMVLAVSHRQARRWGARPGRPWKLGHYGGLRIVQCPAEYRPNLTCASCGGGRPLCARPCRDYLIGFTAHGPTGSNVGAPTPGGCYADTGNVAIHWRKLAHAKQLESDSQRLRRFASSLPTGSILRHHVAGDIGRIIND